MTERAHATTVAIGGRGVMLRGRSGTGKSDLALRLIDRGAILVSDDYTEVTAIDGIVTARAPATIAGKIEIRGVGIVAMPHRDDVPVALVVRLDAPIERLPEQATETMAGIALPVLSLDAFEASAAIKVEIALARLVEGEP
ncbi:MAG: aldolase [Pseudomonadota bacterium]|nr:aldolase [Pseudomonadota bacterium]